jgi:gliding motility-associated-like protein
MKLIFQIFILILVCCSASFAQLTTSGVLNPQQLVQDVLLGQGVSAFNVRFTGANNSSFKAIGSFNVGTANNLGFNSGVVITTGTINGANGPNGPNNLDGAGIDNFEPGDNYLTSLAGAETENAAILEFDFIPQADSIRFKYVFGTDEYMEYIPIGFADVFAFVLNGVTTNMPAHNIALIPGTTTPVTALNVNENVNSQFYIDNENPPGTTVEYDGFTKVLTARERVICGETYHIKIMIADALDGYVDAGVFLQAGSFSCPTPLGINTISNTTPQLGNSTIIYEECGVLSLLFTRPETSVTLADTLLLGIGGTAEISDFTGLNDTLIFPEGEDSVIIQITAVNDFEPDSIENVFIYYAYINSCNSRDTIGFNLSILKPPPIDLSISNDTVICSNQIVVLNAIPNGGVSPYLQHWTDPSGNVVSTSSTFTPPAQIKTYYYFITDACRNDTIFDSVHVDVNTSLYLSGTLDVLGSNNDSVIVEGCGDALLTFTENGEGAGSGIHAYTISITGTNGTNSISDLGIVIPDTMVFNNQTSITYNLSAIADGLSEDSLGNGTEILIITVDYSGNPCIPFDGKLVKKLYIKDPTPFAVDLGKDTNVCKGRSLKLKAVATGGGGTISFNWAHNGSTNSNVTVFPTTNTMYYVSATESCNNTSVSDSIFVSVLFDPPKVSIIPFDSICLRESYFFKTSVTNGVGNLTSSWIVNDPNLPVQQFNNPNSWAIYGVLNSQQYVYSVKDQCNFVDTDTLDLLGIDCELYVPNIVTTNYDNINEIFYIKNLHKNPNTKLKVFNRWGNLMYSSDNYSNDWKPYSLIGGVYYYAIETEKRGMYSGYFHVINN